MIETKRRLQRTDNDMSKWVELTGKTTPPFVTDNKTAIENYRRAGYTSRPLTYGDISADLLEVLKDLLAHGDVHYSAIELDGSFDGEGWEERAEAAIQKAETK